MYVLGQSPAIEKLPDKPVVKLGINQLTLRGFGTIFMPSIYYFMTVFTTDGENASNRGQDFTVKIQYERARIS